MLCTSELPLSGDTPSQRPHFRFHSCRTGVLLVQNAKKATGTMSMSAEPGAPCGASGVAAFCSMKNLLCTSESPLSGDTPSQHPHFRFHSCRTGGALVRNAEEATGTRGESAGPPAPWDTSGLTLLCTSELPFSARHAVSAPSSQVPLVQNRGAPCRTGTHRAECRRRNHGHGDGTVGARVGELTRASG